MPLLQNSTYQPPLGIKNRHLLTILPSVFRKVKGVEYTRQRLALPDSDFVDMDWLRLDTQRVVILCHGLEGDSDSPYIRGMARAFAGRGWSVCAYNYRGCSGEPNRTLRGYHSGATDDLDAVVQEVLRQGYSELVLIGFSLGGNLILKYIGERGSKIHRSIRKGVAIAVPCDLAGSCDAIHRPENSLYLRRFMLKLRKKTKAKKDLLLAEGFDYERLLKSRDFYTFDNLYTAPAHGFSDAQAYYRQCSCRQFLTQIAIPTLLINAQDDTFLSDSCYPTTEAQQNPNFYLEIPTHGGHVGFLTLGKKGEFWSETRAVQFVESDDKFQ